MKKHREEKLGELAMIGEVIFAAFVPVGANYGAKLMPQLQFLAYITLLSSLLFLFVVIYQKEFHQFFRARVWFWLLVYTLCIVVVPYGIIFYFTRYTSALDTTLLLQSEVIYAALISWIFLKERLEWKKVVGIFLLLAASLVILFDGSLNWNLANLAIFLAPCIFVGGNVVAKKLQAEGIGWAPILLFRSFIGGFIVLFFAGLLEDLTLPQREFWPFLLFYSFLVFGVGKIFWQIALKRLDLSKTTALAMTYPILSFIIARIWLGEIPSVLQSFGVALTFIGTLFLIQTHSKQWRELE